VELARSLPTASFWLLWRASRYAHELHRPQWDFAVQWSELRRTGLAQCDLRWLACKGYIQQDAAGFKPCGGERSSTRSTAKRVSDRSSFVLTARGTALAQALLLRWAESGNESASSLSIIPHAALSAPIPCWDRQRRELRIGPSIVKRFFVPAENQEAILAAFEEEAWPAHIDDPLSPVPGIDPKRRLHSTIQCLNRNQQAKLLHFHGDGYGRGVRWELRTA
jgi:hypothetical protein